MTWIALIAGFGAAYGTAKAGVGIASMGVLRPELVMKSIVPIVMAGVLGIYGLIISVIISTGSESPVPVDFLPKQPLVLTCSLPQCAPPMSAYCHSCSAPVCASCA